MSPAAPGEMGSCCGDSRCLGCCTSLAAGQPRVSPFVARHAWAGLSLIPCPSSCLGLGAGGPRAPCPAVLPGLFAHLKFLQSHTTLWVEFWCCDLGTPTCSRTLRYFVFDLAPGGSWNCFFTVTLPNVKNKFSLHFLVRKSMLCAAHPPSPAGETGLDSFGLMDVGAASGCLGFTELLLREKERDAGAGNPLPHWWE